MKNPAPQSAWENLKSELARWHDQGHAPQFWIRDDDATRKDGHLDWLLETCRASEVPIALAVIPARVDHTLIKALADSPGILVLQHGYAHSNHAPHGDKKSEYGSPRPIDTMVNEITKGKQILEQAFRKRALPVFVPPWNRMTERLFPYLTEIGLRGFSAKASQQQLLSASTPQKTCLTVADAHIDIIDWKNNGKFIGEDLALREITWHLNARRRRTIPPDTPNCILTHHKQMEDDAFSFLERLFIKTQYFGALWLSASKLFGVVS